MGPGEYVDNIINLSWDESLALSNDKYYFELKLEYQSSEGNEMYQYLIRGHFETEVLFQDFVDFK